MAIQILCKKPGFRRAGMAHPAKAVYPDGYFTAAQLAALKAEPMLIVSEVPEEPVAAPEPKGKRKR